MSFTDEIKKRSSIDLQYDSIKKRAEEIIDAEMPGISAKAGIFSIRAVIAFSGVALAAIVLLVLVMNKNRISPDDEITHLNKQIDSLAKTASSDEKMLSLVALAKEIQSLSQEKMLKVHAATLSDEIKQTSTDLKNSVEWKDSLDMETDYVLLETLISVDDIEEIYIQSGEKGNISSEDMWVCKNKNFFNELLKTLDVPYSCTVRKPSYDGYETHRFLLYMENDEIVNINVDSNGYLTIGGGSEYYVSLVKIKTKELNTLVSDKSMESYSASISPVLFYHYSYDIAMSSTSGPSMIFHLKGAVAECSIGCGSIEIWEENRKSSEPKTYVDVDKLIRWNPYEPGSVPRVTLLEKNEKAFMEVLFRVDDKLVGFAVIEMKHVDNITFTLRVSGFEISRDDNGNYQEMSVEYATDKIKNLKEQNR